MGTPNAFAFPRPLLARHGTNSGKQNALFRKVCCISSMQFKKIESRMIGELA